MASHAENVAKGLAYLEREEGWYKRSSIEPKPIMRLREINFMREKLEEKCWHCMRSASQRVHDPGVTRGCKRCAPHRKAVAEFTNGI